MNYIPNSIAARDIASLVHMQTNLRLHQQEGPVVISRGEGCRVFDDSGRDYIEAVRAYNTEIRTFPSIIWAKTVFGSKPMAEFAANESSQTPPQVKF